MVEARIAHGGSNTTIPSLTLARRHSQPWFACTAERLAPVPSFLPQVIQQHPIPRCSLKFPVNPAIRCASLNSLCSKRRRVISLPLVEDSPIFSDCCLVQLSFIHQSKL